MRLYELDVRGVLSPSIPLRRTEGESTPLRVCLDLDEGFMPLDRPWGTRVMSMVAERRKEEPGFEPRLFSADLGPNWTLIPSNGEDDRILLRIEVTPTTRVDVPQCGLSLAFGFLEGSSKLHQGQQEAVVVMAPGTGCLVLHPAARVGETRLVELYYSHTKRLTVARTERSRAAVNGEVVEAA